MVKSRAHVEDKVKTPEVDYDAFVGNGFVQQIVRRKKGIFIHNRHSCF